MAEIIKMVTDLKFVHLNDIKKNPDNAKMHSKKQVLELAKIIQHYGFLRPAIIDSDNNLIAGHCRLDAMVLLGRDSMPCLVADGLTKKQKAQLAISHNKTAETPLDMSIVLDEVRQLQELGFDIDLTAYTMKEVIPREKDEKILPKYDQEKPHPISMAFMPDEHKKISSRVSVLMEARNKDSIEDLILELINENI